MFHGAITTPFPYLLAQNTSTLADPFVLSRETFLKRCKNRLESCGAPDPKVPPRPRFIPPPNRAENGQNLRIFVAYKELNHLKALAK